MKSLYLFKWPLTLLLTGFIARTIGIMIKTLHWANANAILVCSSMIMAVSIIWLIIKVIRVKKQTN